MGKKRKLTAIEEKKLGNEAYHSQNYNLALERYTKAIEKGSKDDKSERATYYLNRAQALLKLERWEAAETDCTTAISLTGEATKSKAYGRRAIARKELGTRVKLRAAIDDYRKWFALVVKEDSRNKAKYLTELQTEVESIEKRLREDTASASTVPKSRADATASTSSLPQPEFPLLDDLSDSLPPASQSSSREEKLATIRSSYQRLSQIWTSKKGEMVTAWMDLVLKDVRRARCKQAVDGLMEMGSLRDYPELRSNHLAEGHNILDLVSARALRPPATFAYQLDAIRARTIVASRQPPPSAAVLFGYAPRPVEPPIKAYMNILDDERDLYGKITQTDPDSPEAKSACDRLFEVGEAVKVEVGEMMLERQRVLYVGALRAARVLLDLAGEDAEVDEEVVADYEEQIKSREYAGREDYSLDRVEEIVRSSMAYSEDYYEFLRTDGEFVSEQILDRIPSTVKDGSAVYMMLAKEETIVLILNAFARQSIWNECLAVISELRKHDPRYGTSASIPLPEEYIKKIGLLAKLVEAFIGLAFKELSQAIEKCFAEEFKKMGRDQDDDFWSAMQAAAQFYGLSAPRTQQNVDPLVKMFKALTKLDPATNRKSTFEIVACLNELKDMFDRQPAQKNRLSRRLVDGLGEYQDAIELRETILDAHRPYFDADLADRSTFLANLNPLWTSLERAWLRSASDQTLLRNVLKTRSRSSLDAMWTAFDRQCIKDCKYLPDRLFSKLATIDGTTLREEEESSEESGSEENGSEGSDEDDDGPPPLISGSDDEIPPLDQEDSDDDGPPPLGYDSSDDEASTSSPFRRQVRKGRQVATRPIQPGPSSGLAPSRRGQPPIDRSAITDPSLFGTRDGLREAAEETEEEEPKRRGLKVKTRKAQTVEDDGSTSDATVRGTSSSEWETTDSESEREGLPADFKFKVSRRVYQTFELILGGDGVVRTEVAWIDFMYAMQSIGFQSMKGAGSTWKFRPPLRFRQLGTMVIHEPHPASALRIFQVHKIEARLQRRYKMHISMFTIDNSQRREAATVTH